MQEINYDDLICEAKLKIVIDGQSYVIEQPTLQQIINYEQSVKELIEAGESGAPGGEAGEKWITIIRSVFSNIPLEVLRNKNYALIRRIAKDCTTFIQESMYGDIEEEKDIVQEGEKKKSKQT